MPAKGAASAKAYLMEASTHSLGNSRGLEDGWSEGCVCVHTCACESLLACGCGYVRVFRRLLGADGWEWQKAREEGSIEIIRLPLKD